MSNIFDDMRNAVDSAEITIRAADDVAWKMAKMLKGRLRYVYYLDLVALKRELQDFDAHKKEWKK